MIEVTTARHRARLAVSAGDLARVQALRHLAFRGAEGCDADRFDAAAVQVLVEDHQGRALATFRLGRFDGDDDLARSYGAQFYDLTAFADQPGAKAEVGRLCLHPQARDPEILRLTWAALARLALGQGVQHLFGCASFAGADPLQHAAALAWLGQMAAGPAALRPTPRVSAMVPLKGAAPDPAGVPPLLRFYLGLGGWVADHAMIDADLDTLHVFCALNLAAIPGARARVLRALADPGQSPPRTPGFAP